MSKQNDKPESKVIIDTMKEKGYSIKNVKTWDSHDGGGYCLTLHKGKEKIAYFLDDGNGGGVYEDQVFNKELLKEFEADCKALPQWLCCDKMVDTSVDIVLDELLNVHNEAKFITRNTKSNVLADHGGGKYTKYKITPFWTRKKLTEAIKKDHPDAVIHGGEE